MGNVYRNHMVNGGGVTVGGQPRRVRPLARCGLRRCLLGVRLADARADARQIDVFARLDADRLKRDRDACGSRVAVAALTQQS